MARRSVLVAGAACTAVAAYVLTTFLGGLLDPHYTHVANSISELTSASATHRGLLALGYLIYNVGVGGMAVGLWRTSRPRRSTKAACGLLLVTVGAGVLMLWPFPQDTTGTPATATGAAHIAMASIASLSLLVAAGLLAYGWRGDPRWAPLAPVSLVVAAALLLTGPVGFTMAATQSAFFGLFERAVAVVFLGWFTAIGVTAARASRPTTGMAQLPEVLSTADTTKARTR